MSHKTDVELLRSVAHGSRGPFDRHGASVYRYAWWLTHDREDARDVVQEVFLIAWRKRDSMAFVSNSALPWLLA
jgi:DNA-directed RNA polymerase specialized sigma24 family protein